MLFILQNSLFAGLASAAIATYLTFKLMQYKENKQLSKLEVMYYAELDDLKERYFYQLKAVVNEYENPRIKSISLPFEIDFDYLFKLQMNLIPRLGEPHRELYRQLKTAVLITDSLYQNRDIKVNSGIYLDRYSSARLIVETSIIIYKLIMALEHKDKLEIRKNHSYLEIIKIACIATDLDFDKSFFEDILDLTKQTED
ncbi:hypothetical protein MTF66_05240 [Pseudoalteromonas sp. 2CM39R]|uniref:hypothetical protein n=1 Tax=Pseudoalteromonas sp. 2CM39R TaxID=2929856 RepID=UPI0020BFC05D|nr:hypothetical protein [Pseudoalteromonas sp. 2CM39R]MCK8124392.1 hypothetical protein [Pseudoalteromonas sp. 2CM39R]